MRGFILCMTIGICTNDGATMACTDLKSSGLASTAAFSSSTSLLTEAYAHIQEHEGQCIHMHIDQQLRTIYAVVSGAVLFFREALLQGRRGIIQHLK